MHSYIGKTYIGVEPRDSKVEENTSENRPKNERESGRISWSIVIDFWSIFRAKMPPQTHRKSMKNGIENPSIIEAEENTPENRSATSKNP